MLLDTSGLLSCFDARDERHAVAAQLFRSAPRRVIHNYVLAEFVALCHARRLNRPACLAFVADLMDSPQVEVRWVDEPRHRAAFELLRAQTDKTYSLCDAVSFLLMREIGLSDALTTDRHFEQAGFVRLLKA
ncbi:MAG TPA: PIN domain-containing protein [Tepidisphaeraceae bacterium]|jgi:predicted nucleic acid-binding protein|nr:PIN domain-containing protein [Tepidisphaeraceae bacterium]